MWSQGLCLTAITDQAVLKACDKSTPYQRWNASKALASHGPRGTVYLGGPPLGNPSNFTTMWTKLRVPLELAQDGAWQWHYAAEFGTSGVLKLLNSPAAAAAAPLGEADAHQGINAKKDIRICLTAQSNTVLPTV